MEKFLQTCFLALLCLIGSTFSAQSKVAESPGADLLHRFAGPTVSPHSGDTHRGGETLSDTFLYSTSHDIDGGPWSVSLSNPWTAVCDLETANCKLETAHWKTGFSLVDDSTSPGQEDSIPSARLEAGRFHLELPAGSAPDTIWVSYWEHFLKEHSDVTPGTRIPLVAETGSFFEGSAGYKSFRWELGDVDAPLTFSIRVGKKQLVRYWTLVPGDQVRMRVDLDAGRSYFSGPSAAFFAAQYEVDRVSAEQRMGFVPLMVTGDLERMLSDSLTALMYDRSRKLPESLYQTMDFLVPGKNESDVLEGYLATPLEDYPLIHKLEALLTGLDGLHREVIIQQAYGETLFNILSKLKLGKPMLLEEPHASRFRELVASLPVASEEYLSPAYLAALYELTLLRGKLSGLPLSQLLQDYPSAVSDRIIGLYVLDRFKRLDGEQADFVEKAMAEVETLWVSQLLSELRQRSLRGALLDTDPLLDRQGNPFDLEALKGKSLVISFWVSGCKFCIRYYQESLRPVFEEFKGREDLVFVSVNADMDTSIWERETNTWRYSHPEMVQLHQDASTGILADYRVGTFPQKMLVDSGHRLFLLTTNQYSPEALADKIRTMLDTPQTYTHP
ncbi:hypothetical protein J0A67_17300 [Algoriphagus aestuariicola]|uniref:Thioredoxin domain-containing protein n=1 Tax=Algoriphagus aestuariicola TaxID=1852016 RepID=A0ABS3BUR7_9BACT|nr:hypothetical protein [Algoriphagus aestuariicola]MBN7802636.1 hypothetical protein [Algoriphagus aestuariicola]